MGHAHKGMWICVGLVALVVILAAVGAGGWVLLAAVGCLVMMGAMIWMMSGGMDRGAGRRH